MKKIEDKFAFIRLVIFYLINFALLYIMVLTFLETNTLLSFYSPEYLHDLENTAILLVSYGMVFDEGKSIMKLFGLYPKYKNKFHEKMDNLSHDSGLFCLIFGLFIEIPIRLIKASNEVINTAGIEIYFVYFSILFLILSCIVLIFYPIKLAAFLFSK